MVFNSRQWLQSLLQKFAPRLVKSRSIARRSKHKRLRHPSSSFEQLEQRVLLTGVTNISIGDASITEGNSGTSFLVFTVTRTGDTTSAVSVSYSTANGTATAGSDYTAISDVVTFAAGVTTATIAIPITGDQLFEGNENFSVNLTGVTDSAGSGISFANKQDFSTDTRPRAVAIGDLNGDGKPDVAVTITSSSKVSVYLNTTTTGSSTATFAPKSDFITGNTPYAVQIGDLNGDGKPDLATTNFFGRSVSVLLNTTPTGASSATFATKHDFTVLDNPYYVSFADINGDGRPDLVVADQGSGSISVLLNQTAPGAPTPSFSSKFDFLSGTTPAGWNPDCVKVGDLNGDGKPDLTVANNYSSSLSILLNTTATGAATPTFMAPQDFTPFAKNFSADLADVNADGKLDIAIVDIDDNTVSVLINTTPTGGSTFSFGGRVDYSLGASPHSVVFQDLNGDGLPDLAVTETGNSTLAVLINRTVPGAATSDFAPRQFFDTAYAALSIVSGDINGDGKPDLIEGNLDSSTFSVFLNTLPNPTTTVPLSPAQNFTTDSGAYSVATADFNGDGKPDI
ncbi:MAG: hypothetical protein JWN70_240, partial [Planctomycetaceae bacterium]|nr:hypothetical protein [Planctomycetaceae bacterium]